MPLSLIEAIEPYLLTAYEVVVAGYGEPFLHPEIWRILDQALGHDCDVTIITNGTLLTEQDLVRIVDRRVHRLVISLDTVDATLLSRLRGVSAQLLLTKLAFINRTKMNRNYESPILAVNAVANNQTIKGLKRLIESVVAVGVTELTLAHQKIYAEDQESLSLFHRLEETKTYFVEASDLAQKVGLRLSLPSLDPQPSVCLQPFQMLFVLSNGDVMACCSAIFADDQFAFRIGNLHHTSIQDLWNCDKLLSYRKAAFGRGRLPKRCAACAFRVATLEAHLRLP